MCEYCPVADDVDVKKKWVVAMKKVRDVVGH